MYENSSNNYIINIYLNIIKLIDNYVMYLKV